MYLRLAAILLIAPLLAGFEVSDQIREFGNYGVIGALCIVMGWVLWYKEKEKVKMVKAWDEERASLNAARIVDYKDMTATLTSVRTGLAEWTAARVEGNSTVAALGQAITALAATIQLHTASIDRQTELIDRAAASNRELREALITSGIRL
jgi:undecaprenyl pyrophosphate phosphatase UppP